MSALPWLYGARISAPLCKGSWQAVGLTEGLYRRYGIAFTLNLLLHFLHRGKSVACGGAASAPSEGFGFRAPPVADTARKASRCRPQVRERIAEARAENGEGAKLSFAAALRRQKTEGEITRGCCLHRVLDEHQVKKRSFAFSLAYIKCFRAYSVYLSLRLPAQILYAGIHLPPQREARALPRRAQPVLKQKIPCSKKSI